MARFHKLPKAWSELMSRKNWATISEETLHQEAAALAFLRRYMEDNMGNRGVSISHGCLSKFAMERTIMCRLEGEEDFRHAEYVGFCLGHGVWSALFWPLSIHKDGDFEGYYLDPKGEVEWVHILDPQEWLVLPHTAVLHQEKIYMEVTSDVPLLRFFFGEASCRNSLTIADMTVLSEVLMLDSEQFNPTKMKCDHLLNAILDKVGADDQDWLCKVRESLAKPEKSTVIGDALDEFILSEMPLEEQQDFKEVADEVDTKRKCGWSLVDQKWREQTAKKKPKAKAKRKAKPKPKAVPRRCGRKRKRSEAELQQQEDRQVAPALLDGPAEPVAAASELPAEPSAPADVDSAEAGAVEPEPGPVEPRNDPGDMDDDMTLEELRQQAVRHAAPEDAAPDAVVSEAPPRPERADANQEPARAPRAGPFQEVVQRTDISCPHCNTICGQIKLVPNPGTRDEPTWSMRVKQDGEWPTKGRFFRRRLARLINDDPDDGNNPEGARKWVMQMQMKTCCDAGRG